MLLDGSRTECRWKRDRDAVAPGIIGPKGLPRATRTDYVENSNDSYWLPSARFRIGGFPRIIGPEGTQRLLRTGLPCSRPSSGWPAPTASARRASRSRRSSR